MKLSKAIEGYLLTTRSGNYSENTIIGYQVHLVQLTRYLDDRDVGEVSSTDLKRFITYLKTEHIPIRKNGDTAPLRPHTILNAWCALRSFFNWVGTEFRSPSPAASLERPRFAPTEIQPFSEDELKLLMAASERKQFSIRNAAVMLFMLDTGCRVSELCRIRIKQIDLDSGEVYLEPWGTAKKSKGRNVYLGKSSKRAVWRYLAQREDAQPNDYFLVSHRDRPMTSNGVRLLLGRIGKAAKVTNCHPHRFRHTFAIQYLRNGGDVFTLQRLLGHADLDMVRRYLQLADTDAQNAHRSASPADRWQL